VQPDCEDDNRFFQTLQKNRLEACDDQNHCEDRCDATGMSVNTSEIAAGADREPKVSGEKANLHFSRLRLTAVQTHQTSNGLV